MSPESRRAFRIMWGITVGAFLVGAILGNHFLLTFSLVLAIPLGINVIAQAIGRMNDK